MAQPHERATEPGYLPVDVPRPEWKGLSCRAAPGKPLSRYLRDRVVVVRGESQLFWLSRLRVRCDVCRRQDPGGRRGYGSTDQHGRGHRPERAVADLALGSAHEHPATPTQHDVA